MIDFPEVVQILAGNGGTAPGRFLCYAPYRNNHPDEAAKYVGETSSLAGAFELLARKLVNSADEDDSERIAELRELMQEDQPDEVRAAIQAIRSPDAVRFAGALLSYDCGVFEVLTDPEEAESHTYVCLLGVDWHPTARCVFAAVAVPPNQDAAWAVKQIDQQEAGALSPAERDLAAAAEAGDRARIARALEAGARVSACDERGMSALHRAVARSRVGAVRALLVAGANPRVGHEAGNAPVFAGVRGGQVGPYASRIRSKNHFRCLRLLLEAGAEVDDHNGKEQSLTDIAEATPDLSEEIRALFDRRAPSK